MKTQTPAELIEQLKAAAEGKQELVAKRAGMSRVHANQILNASNCTLKAFLKLAKALNIKVTLEKEK